MKAYSFFPAFLAAILPVGPLFGDVSLPSIISDHMVLKKAAGVPVWGKAEPGEAVTVALGDGAGAKAVAGADGRWKVTMDLSASKPGPFVLKIAGKNQIAINDVVVGEVWVASGQSNMEFPLKAAIDSEKEIAGSADPMFRQFLVARAEADAPADDCQGAWTVAGPETAGAFSAVAYFFGKRLRKDLGVPVGLVKSSYGGTPSEAWTSREAIDTVPHLKDARETALKAEQTPTVPATGNSTSTVKERPRVQKIPSILFNGMIKPLVPYAISGVIWYQGEANANRAWQYRSAFPLLIQDWRNHWKQGDFPFYFCQLANYQPKLPEPSESAWAELREAQSMTLKLPNTGEAVLIDIGEAGDIHPRNKKDAGERLAAVALANHYGKMIPFSGPVYQSMKADGGKIRLAFTHADGGLVAKPLPPTYDVKSKTSETAPLVRNSPDSEVEGFAICGEDKKWVWADAKIEGDHVVVWADNVPAPVAVRYAWADNPTCNLCNGAGFPAVPFRTDDFPATTMDRVY